MVLRKYSHMTLERNHACTCVVQKFQILDRSVQSAFSHEFCLFHCCETLRGLIFRAVSLDSVF